MQINNVSLSVVINGQNRDHPAREFISPMDRQTYIEGRENSNFTLRLRNDNDFRVLIVPSVDGLSVLDGKPASRNSAGYIANAKETIDVPGWVVDQGTAAKFFFAGGEAGYSEQMGHGVQNTGVIGVIAFKESRPYSDGGFKMARARSFAPLSMAPMSKSMRGGGLETFGGVSMNAAVGSTASLTASASTSSSLSAPVGAPSAPAEQERSLSAGFGDATHFKTVKEEFKRGDVIATMELFYKDARGLKKLGIDVDAPVARPSAFPADNTGCATPAGWNRG